MKKIISLLAIYASLAVMAATVFTNNTEVKAQTPAPAPAPAAAKGPCTDEAKAAWYADFTKLRTTDPNKAAEAGKKYLAACPQEQGPIPDYLKKWIAAYDKEARKGKFKPLLYNDKKYTEALALGKEILAEDPENLSVIIDMGWGSYLAAVALKNESLNNDAVTYAKKAIQLIESNKAPESWLPFKSKEETLAYLYNVVGRQGVRSNPTEALNALIKSVQLETDLKKDPWNYYFIGASYESGPYTTLSADYKTKYLGKDETNESKLALENINQVIDRMVDAYARAVALAGNDPKYQANKKDWLDALSTWYKYRHNQSDAGINEMIASVLSKPLPPLPTPITTLPAAPPAATTPTSGTPGAAGADSSSGAATSPAGTKPANAAVVPATPAATKPATPTPTATPKPKPRNNHARRH
jgi:tetratricopeptide (TPR) repeat protein